VTRTPAGSQPPDREQESALSFSLAATPRAAGHARQALALAPVALAEHLGRDGLLLLTELVNNAVIHGSSDPADEVSVRVRESHASVRVEVRDEGPGFTWRHPPSDPQRTTGYGLVLVEAVANRWGIDTSTGRTCVWFEL
jgi:anti-sigma regulatory factor (Ser/Thr protein kinase)